MMVIGWAHSSSPSRMARIAAACSSWVPWEKLSLATSMPALTSFRSISGLRLAGPIVQTMRVRLT